MIECPARTGPCQGVAAPARPYPGAPGDRPALLLAPMQDVTDLTFWNLCARRGGADVLVTEYFRVHADSRPDRHIVRSIEENSTGRPVLAQMIGQDIPALIRTARALQRYPIAGIDLNLGCPAPIVCRKTAGGGLLPFPERIDEILGALRAVVDVPFTVKTRIGFDAPEEFDRLLELFARHPLDGLTVHGRTVREMYRTTVHYDRIAQAVRSVPFPVIANGNIASFDQALAVWRATGCAGWMIGRWAIRNPWIFDQIREGWATGRVQTQPTLRDVRAFVLDLFEAMCREDPEPARAVNRIKRHLNFIGIDLEPTSQFLFHMRRSSEATAFLSVLDQFLDSNDPLPSPQIALPSGS